uniref:Putative secreted protein n=1 Tax=Anopheles darlingi TaxID=43151 RepID=A0A2M4DN85_ANODA
MCTRVRARVCPCVCVCVFLKMSSSQSASAQHRIVMSDPMGRGTVGWLCTLLGTIFQAASQLDGVRLLQGARSDSDLDTLLPLETPEAVDDDANYHLLPGKKSNAGAGGSFC